ncbi:MAG: VOC family protein, partial [Alphaproteobacteria bacterium]|nr:VOC family protein [Alphaproteobacteria bacterium]
MRLKNILIVVKDIEKSRKFYHDLFGIDLVLDNDGNMVLTEGLVLQDEKIWKNFLEKDILSKSNSCELYFEEQDIEGFIKKMQEQSVSKIYFENRNNVDSAHHNLIYQIIEALARVIVTVPLL